VELPPVLFEDVTGVPAASANPTAGERPVANWVFLGQKTTLLREPDADLSTATRIRRISVQGIGLLHEQAISIGEEFTLLLPRPQRSPVSVRCSSVRCEEGGDGLYRIGAVFIAVLSDEYDSSTHNAIRPPFEARPLRAATLAA
jgi:hypothetical protein